MGTVYRAAHPSLPRSDALKILSAELSQNPDFRARFIREADLAATLDHPNIVAVYNRGETDEGQLWIAMQYVPGSDADNEVKGNGMDPGRAVHIIGEVAKALDHAHRRKLLHRDVKPANFLLAPDDERVLLADFGIARALDDATGLTATGMVLASVAYAAPESLSGQHVDGRADIYSLGCSLYRMLSGTTPFSNSGGWAATAAAHISQSPPPLTARNPALPAAIDDVITKAMAKEPDERYQSAQDLARATADALDADLTAPVRPKSTVTAPWTPAPQPAPTRPPPTQPNQPPRPAWQQPGSYPGGYFSGPPGQAAGGGYGPPAPGGFDLGHSQGRQADGGDLGGLLEYLQGRPVVRGHRR
jgi:eukaryotic-like serine/threonine-protein kinase